MNDVTGILFYVGLFALWGILIAFDQRYRIFPRDPVRRKPAEIRDVSERETAPMRAMREPVAR